MFATFCNSHIFIKQILYTEMWLRNKQICWYCLAVTLMWEAILIGGNKMLPWNNLSSLDCCGWVQCSSLYASAVHTIDSLSSIDIYVMPSVENRRCMDVRIHFINQQFCFFVRILSKNSAVIDRPLIRSRKNRNFSKSPSESSTRSESSFPSLQDIVYGCSWKIVEIV